MSDPLATYRAKRNFAITAEPAEGGTPSPTARAFVIQKHWASRLHYDLRLELDGTMKSWAVPKGPSYDPHDKRMAVQVEDHPIAYNSFEGTIPDKQYGAGKVIIWDQGTWEPLVDPEQGYADGNLRFTLRGHKMHGNWVLVRMKGKGEKQKPWLLIKEKDAYVRPASEFSVVDEMPDSVKDLAPPKQKKSRARAPAKQGSVPEGAVKAALPATLSPQLATLVEAPPADGTGWLFELKFDGYRMLARIQEGAVQLFTRTGKDWTAKLSPLQAALVAMNLPDGWYDGEIVVHDAQGKPDFGLLQAAFDGSNTADIVYFLFDLPYCDGVDLRAVALTRRRAMLAQLLEKRASEQVRFSAEFGHDPAELVTAACKLGLEGVIGKKRDGHYVTRRSADWIKLKCGQRQEFVIAGYTDPQGARTGIGALLLATYDADGVLRYAGNVGSGFNRASLATLKDKLTPLETDASPFAGTPAARTVAGKKHHWVKPVLVAEVSFAEWTSAGAVRHAVFQGLRTDKKASAITRELAQPLAAPPDQAAAAPPSTLPAGFKVTHGERVIDTATGATKLDVIRYYALVGELMLPHLQGRPVSLVRAPAGVAGELFFQKHADSAKLAGIKQMKAELDPEHPPMLEVASVQGILSAAQWNVIEFHTQNALGRSYEKPNRMVFDLDPGAGVDWTMIQQAAQLLRAFLDELALPSFLKTSGGKGLHVVVPLKATRDWDSVKDFSRALVEHMAITLPERFSVKSGPKNRVGKIFIDYLRNGRGATTACAWSARTRPGLGISVPVHWDELDQLTAGDQWHIGNVQTRLDRGNTPWDGYAQAATTLTAAMKTLGYQP